MKSFQHASTYAFAACLIAILLSLGLHFTGQYQSALNYLSYVGYVVMAVLAIRSWKKQEYNGFISYGKAFGHTTYLALTFSIILAIWTYVFFEYIAHDEIIKMQSDEMAKQAVILKKEFKLSDAQIKEQFEFAKKFMSGGVMAVSALVMNMIMLTIMNLVIAAFTKKDDPSLNSFENPSVG